MSCEYCEKSLAKPIDRPSRKYKYIAISGTKLCLLNDYTVTKELTDIRYCFQCGSKLGDSDD